MTGAFRKDITRTIRGNLKRFVSIAVICALGVAMFCGLRAACTDLRNAADSFFDTQRLFDLQVLSTLGLDDDDIAALASVEGVEAAEGGWTETTYTDVEGARASVEVKALSARGLNMPYVVDGELPEAADEVAVTQKFIDASGLKIGDTVEISEAENEDEAVFARHPYRICGIVVDAMGVSNPELSFRSSSSSDYTFFVTPDAVEGDAYTVAYLTVEGADELAAYSDEYTEHVRKVTDRIEDEIRADREAARTAAVKGEAQAELDDARAEFEAERADAEAELAEGWAELEDAARQLGDALEELISGQAEIDDGWAELNAGEAEIAEGRAQLAASQEELDAQRATAEAGFASAQAEIDEYRATLAAGREQLEAGEAELEANEQLIAEEEQKAVEQVNSMISKIPGGPTEEVSTAEEAYAAIDPYANTVFDARDAVAAAQQSVDELQDAYDALDGERVELQTEKDTLEQTTIPELTNTVEGLEARKAELEASLGEGVTSDEEYQQVLLNLEDARNELNTAEARLETVTNDLATKTEEIKEAEGKLEEAKAELTRATQSYTFIERMMATFGITVEQLEEAVNGLTKLINGKAALAQGREELEASRAELEAGEARLETGQAELNSTRSQVRATLASAQTEIDRGYAELEAGAASLPAARQALIDAQAELDRGRAEYEDGMAEYQDGLAEWQDGRTEADEQFAKAEAELADAQAEIDDIDAATWYVQTRSSLSSYSSISSDADSIEAIGTLFPIVFLVVAALVSLTTITRLVEEERGLIGTYKALGYRNGEIFAKYLTYALAACISGCLLGLFLGFIALPAFIFTIFDIMYLLPSYGFSFEALYGFGGMAIFIVAIGGTAYLACRSEVRRTPAELMRPKAPKSGSRIFLEHIPAVWSRLSFLNKVTARNLFRYKRRFFMTVAGILGCTALIVCGFAIKDSVAELVPEQYERIAHYSILAAMEPDGHNDAIAELAEDARVDEVVSIYIDTTTLKYNANEESVQLIVIPDDYARSDRFSRFVSITDLDTGASVDVPKHGAVITQNASEVLSFSAKDTVELQDSHLEQAEIDVARIARNYLGNYVYMTQTAYLEAFGDRASALDDAGAFQANGVLVRCTGDDAEASLTEELTDDSRFLSVTSTDELAEDFSKSFMLINAIVAIVLGMAAALAFAVLFTLSTTNISERERELATIKVLGFRPREVHHYVNKETIILTMIGIVCGLPLGYVLGDMLLHALKMPSISFLTVVTPLSYVFAAVLPLVFALAVNLITNRTLNRIDMIEALKSVE